MVKRVETDKKNLEHYVKQVLKKLVSNKTTATGYKSMDLDGLDLLLTKHLKGFKLVKNSDMSMTVTWVENGVEIEETYSVDPNTGEINKD
ncbi:hypothetical protein [Neobacillus sp. 114]|uniref:hypothetical protein n=1 Tax=Neobacillus sp. 114 TaxID=3048535 RepID=UPI0024C25BF4|nr:hypothetical protein [Neobacillus sp. 114]